MPSGKYALVDDAARVIWGKKSTVMDECKAFYGKHAGQFVDAPLKPTQGEQNLEMYALYQEYLKLFEGVLEDYIETQNVSIREFYQQLGEVQNDPNIMDKKLVHFVNYLVACTDYDSFYKMMVRAAKKQNKADAKSDAGGSGTRGSKSTSGGGGGGSKGGYDDYSDVKGSSRGDYDESAKGATSSRADYK